MASINKYSYKRGDILSNCIFIKELPKKGQSEWVFSPAIVVESSKQSFIVFGQVDMKDVGMIVPTKHLGKTQKRTALYIRKDIIVGVV